MPGGRCIGIVSLILVSILAGCGARPPAAAAECPAEYGAPSLMVVLFFGRSMPDGDSVSDRAWHHFVDRVVAPALPRGFTVLNAFGAWLSPQGRTIRHEPTKLLLVALPDSPRALAPVQQIRDAYQRQFHQQLVGMSIAPACATF